MLTRIVRRVARDARTKDWGQCLAGTGIRCTGFGTNPMLLGASGRGHAINEALRIHYDVSQDSPLKVIVLPRRSEA